MPVTIHDLAKLAGLNASTISRALRNDPRVRKSTRELVRELARRHGYTPNLPARQLAAGRTGNIWFSFGSPQAAIELETAMALNDLVTRGKYDLQLVLHNNSPERLRQHLNKLCQKVADGVLVIPPGDTDACAGLTGLVNSLPVPVIMVYRYWAGLECPVVTSDNREPVRRMIDRCVEWGARSFYLEYAGSNPVSRNRAEAARACLAERNLPVLPYPDSGRIDNELPAAVLGNSGSFTPTGRAELYGAFFDGCDNSALRSFRHVIVCRQNFPAIAERAASILFGLLHDPEAEAPAFTEIPPREFLEL